MAEYVTLECPDCGNRNYRTPKPALKKDRLELKKYCRFCRKHSAHKERRK